MNIASQEILDQTRTANHADCVLCGNCPGLSLRFAVTDAGAVAAEFDCPQSLQGYGGMLHGGVIASLLDSAMTNCLFAHGVAAVTAELVVRYRHPVVVDTPVVVVGKIANSSPPLYHMEARMEQNGKLVARAKAKFMQT